MSDTPFGRQPQRIAITVEGDPRDVHDMQYKLQRWLANQAFNVDFQYEPGKTVLFLYPWAVND